MLPEWFIGFAILLRLFSGGRYAWGILHGRARPNPVTWFLWGSTAMVAFIAQVNEGVGAQAIVTFVLGLSPLTIAVLATVKGHLRAHLTPFTYSCAAITLGGVFLWQITDNAIFAIACSILADIAASAPTLLKGYRDPKSEYALPYLLSVISMAITLLTITRWNFETYAFPLYMLLINCLLFAMPLRQVQPKKRTRHKSRKARPITPSARAASRP